MEDVVDEVYEFSAPKFYDFVDGETEEEAREAELWFETALSHAPSPFMMRVKAGRTAQVGSLCDFSDAVMEEPKCCASTAMLSNIIEGLATKTVQSISMPQSLIETAPMKENLNCIISKENEESLRGFALQVPVDDKVCHVVGNTIHERNQSAPGLGAVPVVRNEQSSSIISSIPVKDECTPKPYTLSSKRDGMTSASHQQHRAKIAASGVQNPSTLKPTHHSQLSSSRARSIKKPPHSAARNANMKNSTETTPTLAQENQAIKRQKLEGGRSRQIINVKVQNLPHKSRFEVNGDNNTSTFCSSISKPCKQKRKIYVREPAAPFVSMAEMMKKFQSSTREMPLPQNLLPNAKPHLTLTTPKEPDFETAQRVRPVRVKSSAEIEEEMMAKIPKFKARPLNKKILQAPTLHAMPKSVPRPPEFQEFHLETMARASKAAEVSSSNSMESSCQNDNQWRPHRVEPKAPRLHTAMRARPYKVKSFAEIEQEVLENIPKFKARPLNKKIFESKGDMGLFCNTKKQVTVPQEFHFAIDERIPPPAPAKIAELLDKLSLNSEPNHDHPIPKLTRPNPFHLQTEERGAEKERKLVVEVTLKQLEEERARIPKATPLPYSTDFPMIPPKPEPKPCTRPEPFQLESLVRHEDEMQREMEERRKKEREEAEMRIFKAQPIIREDPIPLPEKERKPLTQVQQFNLHLEHRAVDRAEFDKQIKEKELMYKRYRDESEAAKMVEEEKALKQLRRTLVPHARPVPDFANPFIPEKSYKETTKAKSPKLRIFARKERLKSNVGAMKMAVASSSPAAHMR